MNTYCEECGGECDGCGSSGGHSGWRRPITEQGRVEQAANILLSNGYGFVDKVFEKVKELRAAATAAKANQPTPF